MAKMNCGALKFHQPDQVFTECKSVTSTGLLSYRKCALLNVEQAFSESCRKSQNGSQAIDPPLSFLVISQSFGLGERA